MSPFVKVIRDAQALPPGSEAQGYDAFGRARSPALAAPSGGPLGAPEYHLQFHAQRFMVGKELVGFDEGAKIFEDRDDVEELARVQNLILAGKAIQGKRLENILGDGTVVVWLEWYTSTAPDTPRPPNALSEGELRSPQRVTPLSKERDAAAEARPMDDDPEELAVPQPETEAERASQAANEEEAW